MHPARAGQHSIHVTAGLAVAQLVELCLLVSQFSLGAVEVSMSKTPNP